MKTDKHPNLQRMGLDNYLNVVQKKIHNDSSRSFCYSMTKIQFILFVNIKRVVETTTLERR